MSLTRYLPEYIVSAPSGPIIKVIVEGEAVHERAFPPFPPSNDNFTNAITITSIPYSSGPINTASASVEPYEILTDGSATWSHTIWFKYTPGSSQSVNFRTFGVGLNPTINGFDTVIAVYTGTTLNNLVLIASDDDGLDGGGGSFLQALALIGGTTYYIQCSGFDDGIDYINYGYDTFTINLAINISRETESIQDTQAQRKSLVRRIFDAINIIDSQVYQYPVTFEAGIPAYFFTDSWTAVTTGTPHSGTYHVKSGAVTANKSSAITSVALCTQISFWWKISAASTEYGEFYIDGIQQTEISGSTSYAQYTVTGLTNTIHVFEWRYAKVNNTVTGDDALYLDDVLINGTWYSSSTNSFYTFETGLSDLTTSGDVSWAIATDQAYQATHSAKSGAIIASQTTTLALSKKTDQIGFWLRGSSETNNDLLSFSIDGSNRWIGSGSGIYNRDGWTFIFYPNLSPDSHAFQWTYAKNPTTNAGSDAYWLDYVQYRELFGTRVVSEVVYITEVIAKKSNNPFRLIRFAAERMNLIETTRSAQHLLRLLTERESIIETTLFAKKLVKIINELSEYIIESTIKTKSNLVLKIIAETVNIKETSARFSSNLIKKIINESVIISEVTSRIRKGFARVFSWIS